jgi:cell division protein YceG involved in septum cleavage
MIFWARTDENGIVGAHAFSATLDEHNQAVARCRELGYCG